MGADSTSSSDGILTEKVDIYALGVVSRSESKSKPKLSGIFVKMNQ